MEIFTQAAAILGILVVLAGTVWALQRRGLATLTLRPGTARRMQVLERLPLTAQHALHLVRVDGKVLLVASAPAGCTLLVGHNPSLEQLVALLLEGRSDDYRGLPPGGLACIKLPDEGELEPGCGTAKHFWFP